MDAATRNGIIVRTSLLGVVANIFLAAIKVVVGLFASSIAIVSEGVNNAADALTSILTLVGTKLASKHPDEKHPFGYGRIEYLTGLVIAVIIIVSGAQMFIESLRLVFHPKPLAISALSLGIVAVSAILKFSLGLYTIARGKAASSDALIGVGVECRADSYVSLITILTAVIFLVTGVSIDAYAGLVMSAIILKAGVEVLRKTVSELIGRPGERDLASRLYKRIRATPGISGAADMMLHNYGPDAWSGSANIEIDHAMSVGEAYAILHDLQLKIMHEEKVTMVFGVYAVGEDHEETQRVREKVSAFVRQKKHVKSFHAVYLEPGSNRIYCDLVVDYELKDWDQLRAEFLASMAESFPTYSVELTIETDFI